MKKILLYAVGCVVIVLCVVCYFVFTQTRELQECKSERDKISGCVEKEYDGVYGARLWVETPYQNDKTHGVAKGYYESGNLMREIPYKNDVQHGVEKWYYENRNLEFEAPYDNGKKHGVVKEYYENGILRYETPYENGKRHGVGKEYDENGNLEIETPFKNGKLHGVEKWYYKNGNLKYEKKMDCGCFDRNDGTVSFDRLRSWSDSE